MNGNGEQLLAEGDYIRAGREFERSHRWDEAVDAYVQGGAFSEAGRLLESMARFREAGRVLLRYLPDKPTPVRRLTAQARREAMKAALNFARGGARDEAVGLLMNLGEHTRAASLLRMAGLRKQAVLAMRGEALPGSPWPKGVLFALRDPEEPAPPPEPDRLSRSRASVPPPPVAGRRSRTGRDSGSAPPVDVTSPPPSAHDLSGGGGDLYPDSLERSSPALAGPTSPPGESFAAGLDLSAPDSEFGMGTLSGVPGTGLAGPPGSSFGATPMGGLHGPTLAPDDLPLSEPDIDIDPADRILDPLWQFGPDPPPAKKVRAKRVTPSNVPKRVVEAPPSLSPDASASAEGAPPSPEPAPPRRSRTGTGVGTSPGRRSRPKSRVGKSSARVGGGEREKARPAGPGDSIKPTGEIREGTVLANRYQLEKLIGAGGMARVYRTMDLELEERIALKIFLQFATEDEEGLRRFRQEMKLSRKLIHPNIVRIYEFGAWHGARFITMELLDGLDLEEWTQKHGGVVAPDEVLRLMIQACAGLQAAHEAGVIHRDVKPSNFFIVEDGKRLKLMDFGVAKVKGANQSLSSLDARIGTPRYMSPEQIQGGVEVGPAADLYALGAVMYELLTGRRVFPEDDLVPLLLSHLSEPPIPLRKHQPNVPENIEEIVMRLLEKEPKARFASCGDLRRTLVTAYVGMQRGAE